MVYFKSLFNQCIYNVQLFKQIELVSLDNNPIEFPYSTFNTSKLKMYFLLFFIK